MPRLHTRRPLVERFHERYRVDADSGCWIWQSSFASGYGCIGRGGKGNQAAAHRISYELHFGPIPEGMLVCHTCDVRACCNPKHLFLGTYSDNAKDCLAKGRQGERTVRGEQQGGSKLTEADVVAIRGSTAPNAEVAARYGISRALVSRVRTRRSWKHVPPAADELPPPGRQYEQPMPGEANGRAKVTAEIVRQIRETSGSARKVGLLFGLGPSQVRAIQQRKSWSHIP